MQDRDETALRDYVTEHPELEHALEHVPIERPRQVVSQGLVGTLAAAGMLQAAAQATAARSRDGAPVRARAVETVPDSPDGFQKRKALLKQGFQYSAHDGRNARFRRLRQRMAFEGRVFGRAVRGKRAPERVLESQGSGQALAQGPGADLQGLQGLQGPGADLQLLAADLRVRWAELAATLPDALGPRGCEILREVFYQAAGYAD